MCSYLISYFISKVVVSALFNYLYSRRRNLLLLTPLLLNLLLLARRRRNLLLVNPLLLNLLLLARRRRNLLLPNSHI
jgi:hypothetical protein